MKTKTKHVTIRNMDSQLWMGFKILAAFENKTITQKIKELIAQELTLEKDVIERQFKDQAWMEQYKTKPKFIEF